jgi:threonine/homoserine/homoserine lactone efflux protein
VIDLLPSWPLFVLFLGASLVLAITPGPGVFHIVTRSLTQGRSSGLASVAGIALGNLGNAICAAVGLVARFRISSVAFALTKYAGAGYLIYLGLRTFFSSEKRAIDQLHGTVLSRVFRDAFTVALLNPKTAIFFAAFLPQFMGVESVQQSILLGTTFVAIAAITDTMYALSASAMAPVLRRTRRVWFLGRGLRASAFLSLGLYTAFAGLHSTER